MSLQQRYSAVNLATAPLWAAMIVAPRSRLTRWLIRGALPLQAGLGVGYAGLMGTGIARNGPPAFGSADAVRQAFADPAFFLAGWSHYVAFDLFVGRWIWEDALATGRTARVALLLTLAAGPLGLTTYLAQRRLGRWS